MRLLLVCVAFLFTMIAMMLDNHTTHYALTVYSNQGAVEGNPIARQLFDLVGLEPGLILSTVLATGLYIFVACTRRMVASTKIAILMLLGSIRFTAGISNMSVISTLALLGGN